jgi:hypothetical protein
MPSRSKLPAPTTPISRFPIEHVAQSSTAQATTEALCRIVRTDHEHFIAAGPLAHPNRKILGICCWALALARRGSCFDWLCGFFGQHHQRNPSPIPLTLLAAANLPLLFGPPDATRLATPPAPGRHPACFAAIAALRMTWPVGSPAPFEQAVPATNRRRWDLCRSARHGILRWAQGSCCSRRSSLGDELTLASETLSFINHPISLIGPDTARQEVTTNCPAIHLARSGPGNPAILALCQSATDNCRRRKMDRFES